ncbi:MAG: hypothetical protein HY289_15810 [Planctomycetes bacterium]|nr:hypothetical protein [Planctomycetota bacterium]
MKLHFDKETMHAEVLKYLSPEMPIENAKRIMEDSGFKSFLYQETGSVRYSAVYGRGFLSVHEIGVVLSHESGKLKEIKVDCLTISP